MNIKQKLKNDLNTLSTPAPERVLPVSAQGTRQKARPHRRPLGVMVTAVILAGLLIIGGVAAIPEIVKRLNATQLTDQSYRITEIPTGWVGIYTLDDLELLRNADYRSTDFILMNDIEIPDAEYAVGGRYENGFEPLGIYEITEDSESANSFFEGDFNGNGYTVRNLKIVPSEQSVHYNIDLIGVGLFGYTSSKITYLGVENVEIVVNSTWETDGIYVGAIAGKANFVGGCYAENVTIRYNCTGTVEETAAIGGLCGYTEYLDSCYVKNATLQVNDESVGKTMLVGGVVGTANSCVTSYFTGNVNVTADRYETCVSDPISAMLYPAYTPILLTEDAMEVIKEKLKTNVDDFDYKKFMTYYFRMDLDNPSNKTEKGYQALQAYFDHLNANQAALYSVDVSEVRCWYVFATDASIDEVARNTELLIQAFGGTESYEAFCMENNIKCGKLYCYGFPSDTAVTAADLPAFDLESIWIETENGISLRAFTE